MTVGSMYKVSTVCSRYSNQELLEWERSYKV